jgi:hypothetical protein
MKILFYLNFPFPGVNFMMAIEEELVTFHTGYQMRAISVRIYIS